jgi:hypothetical protein
MFDNNKTSSTTVHLEFLSTSRVIVKLTMAKPFKPLTNLFLCVPPVVDLFLARAIANTQPSSLWLAARFGTVENPVAAPRAVRGFFGLQGAIATGRGYQGLLKT